MSSLFTQREVLYIINKYAYHVLIEVYVAVFGVLIPFAFIVRMEAVDSSETMINTYQTIVRRTKKQL
jgi:hypothetical protein